LKPETKFWHKVKKAMPEISFTRLENLSGFGTPDLLAYNKFLQPCTKMKNFMKALAACRLQLKA
jgi:hypothetical protein